MPWSINWICIKTWHDRFAVFWYDEFAVRVKIEKSWKIKIMNKKISTADSYQNLPWQIRTKICRVFEWWIYRVPKKEKKWKSSMNKKNAMAGSYQNLPRRNSRKLNLSWTRKIAMADSYWNLPWQKKSCKLNCHDK